MSLVWTARPSEYLKENWTMVGTQIWSLFKEQRSSTDSGAHILASALLLCSCRSVNLPPHWIVSHRQATSALSLPSHFPVLAPDFSMQDVNWALFFREPIGDHTTYVNFPLVTLCLQMIYLFIFAFLADHPHKDTNVCSLLTGKTLLMLTTCHLPSHLPAFLQARVTVFTITVPTF